MAAAEASLTESPSQRKWRRIRAEKSVWLGAALVGISVCAALFAGWIAPYQVDATSDRIAEPASSSHWLGTDAARKDVLTRVLYGSRLSLIAGFISVALAVTIGAPWGAIAGYGGGRIDTLLMRSIDVALAFPSILLALLVATAWRPSWETVIVAVGLINVPPFARQVRATVLTLAQLDYVQASRAMGATDVHILLRVILPSLVSPIIVLASLSLGSAILEVAGLAFLGLGGDPTAAEWGTMLSQAKDNWSQNPWCAVGPGLAISLTVLGFNLLGDGLRDALDPRST